MSVLDQIEALKKKHAELETELEDESRRPLPNSGFLSDLKRKKLAIKDEIAKLTQC